MTSIRQCTMNDLFYFNNVNLDVLTETYNLQFYMQYMTYWPESFIVAKTTTTTTATTTTTTNIDSAHYNKNDNCNSSCSDNLKMKSNSSTISTRNNSNSNNSNVRPIIMGYLLGKAEGEDHLWHGHVSAITISKYYRRISVAKYLMIQFETTICTIQKQNYFVDLFVRASNTLAIQMYHNLGYGIYRTVIGYYQSSSSNSNSNSSKQSGTSTDSNRRHAPIPNPPEDAYDMRKSLLRDPQKLSMIPLPHPIYPEDLEW